MIAIVVPTIRPESYEKFKEAWSKTFSTHDVKLVTVIDGEHPTVEGLSIEEVMGDYSDTIFNFNDGVRNLGFAYAVKYLPDLEYIVSLDDDVAPFGFTIEDHIDALQMKVPITWMSTASEYTRGFPYGVREEAEVVLSHGVWRGVADWDAATQLVRGNPPVDFYKGVIPKGVLFPLCAMNFAFKRKILPYIYQAPMFGDMNRFADIYAGIRAKREIDAQGWAAVTGYSTVKHERASNVFTNLIKEAKGLKLNETYHQGDESDPYFAVYNEKYKRWQEFIAQYI